MPAASAAAPDLFDAIRAGDRDRVQALLDTDAELVNQRNERGHSPVLIALYHHKREILSLLLARRPTLDLYDACSVGDTARVRELLEANPSLLNAYTSDGFFPLGLAAFFGQPETVRFLLDRGADVNVVARNPMKVQALHAAAASRKIDTVRMLLEAGAPVNTGQQEGWTALHAAAKHGDVEMARLLLARGADPKQPNDQGVSAIGVAAERNDTAMLKALKGV
jgi:ankyrin repeat protein